MGWKIPGICIFPQETRQKFLNMPQIIPFQITLSFMVIRIEKFQIFILPSGSSGKNFRFFFNSPQTLNLAIKLKFSKNLKFRKLKFSVLKKFFKNYLIFFYKMEKSYQNMNVKELKALAKERGIKKYY